MAYLFIDIVFIFIYLMIHLFILSVDSELQPGFQESPYQVAVFRDLGQWNNINAMLWVFDKTSKCFKQWTRNHLYILPKVMQIVQVEQAI